METNIFNMTDSLISGQEISIGYLKPNILLLDNFDSFTYNLADYLLRLGANCTVMRNNQALNTLLSKSWDGIVLSPGPGRPENAGNLMPILERVGGKIPVLGVCLGHQAIGMLFGAQLVKAERPMHGKLSSLRHSGSGVFKNIPQNIKVVRYHSLVLRSVSLPLQIIAETEKDEIMAIYHSELPFSGIQFHPEAVLTEYGLEMLQNWLSHIALNMKENEG